MNMKIALYTYLSERRNSFYTFKTYFFFFPEYNLLSDQNLRKENSVQATDSTWVLAS